MRYVGENTVQISFPLGGIGSGCVGLAGNGALVDFEIMNRPNKRSLNGYSGFAIRAEAEGRVVDARILQGDFQPPYMGEFLRNASLHSGYGFGPSGQTLAGLRHFAACDFEGEFPVARLCFRDNAFPGQVETTALNPFVPLCEDDSSLPAAFFQIEVENTGKQPMAYTVYFFLGNPFGVQAQNDAWHQDGLAGITLGQRAGLGLPPEAQGDLSLVTNAEESHGQTYWYRGGWCDGLEMFWNDVCTPGPLPQREYGDAPRPGESLGDGATLAATLRLDPGQRGTARFSLTWSFPLRYNDWNPEKEGKTLWKNEYAVLFPSSRHSAVYALEHWQRLWQGTMAFHDALFQSTLPPEVLDAVSANLSVLKSPTVMRLEDGSFYGFEGCIADIGCCEGSCTHVWNYAYALPFLFPALERSMRTLDYAYNQRADGRMSFRLMLPLGREPMDFRACVDGQMGGVVKTYREFKLSGDIEWLSRLWPRVKKSLEYAWASTNEDRWDPGATGILSGRQHHTLDMELFGPNSWLQGFYLAALAAGAELAEALGEMDTAAHYHALFDKGYAYVNNELFDGDHFIQRVDLKDKGLLDSYRGQSAGEDALLDSYWNAEKGQIKYQIGEGCAIDQVLAGWHARLCGLPRIFDEEKERKALKAIYNNNFQDLRQVNNTWRNFGLSGEEGLLMCTWPGERPAVPLTYASECMTGFEYQAACHMLLSGMEQEGLSVVRAVRARYDGKKRNPWNEMECGSNYARSMASYSLLLAYSGFRYDLFRHRIGFWPLTEARPFRCFWSVGTGWGTVIITKDSLELKLLFGRLEMEALECGISANEVTREGAPVGFIRTEQGVALPERVLLVAGQTLCVKG